MASPGQGLDALWRRALSSTVPAMFAVLGVALALGRVPLPGGDSFSYASWARNLVVAALAGHLLRAPGRRLRRSSVGAALIVYAGTAALSVLVNRGRFGDLRTLATGVGMFFVARSLAAGAASPLRLLDWLGTVVIALVVHEIVADPAVLLFRESARLNLSTDHPNTLGFALAVLFPLFLGGAADGPAARRAAFYAVTAAFGAALTLSRAAWLGIALGVAAIALAIRSRERLGRASGRSLPALAFAFAVALALAGAVAYLSLERGESDLQRLRIVETSWTLFREHWLLGVGYGTKNLERVFPSRYIELFGASLFLFHSHNLYVDALVGTGLVGTSAAAWLVVRLLALARRALKSVTDSASGLSRPEAVSFATAIAVFLLLGLADMPFYHGRLTILVAVALAYIEHRVEQARTGFADIAGDSASP